jgi:2-methylisocitrate lyase-like PEP mutase family enzyme
MGSISTSTENGVARVGAATKLRQYLESESSILLCPGVYDGFSTRIALSVGFDCLYMVMAFPISPASVLF